MRISDLSKDAAIWAIQTANETLTDPFLAGGILYLLTRGPADMRSKILSALRCSNNSVSAIIAFKILTAMGVVKRINWALDKLARNYWKFGQAGAGFNFSGDKKEEVIVITGASSGFGFEMVRLFAPVAKVVAVDVNAFPEELAALPDVYFYQCDLTDAPAVVAACEEIRKTHGNPSVLINNAGVPGGKYLIDASNEHLENLFKVNLISHFILIREFLPGMLEMKKGHLVSIASMASVAAMPGMIDYCCSKIGTTYLTEGIRTECLAKYPGGEGIRTTSVHPSWHSTAILRDFERKLNRQGIFPDPPINVARKVYEQVIKAKSGRLVIPARDNIQMGFRNWPLWVRDVAMGLAFRK